MGQNTQVRPGQRSWFLEAHPTPTLSWGYIFRIRPKIHVDCGLAKNQNLKYTSWQKTSHPKIWSAWQTLNFIEKKWTSGLISFADTLCQTQFQWYERNLDMTPTFHTFCYAPFFLSYLYSSVFWRTYHHSAKIIVNWQDNVYDSVSESESRKFYRLSFDFDSGKNGRRQPTPTPVSTPTLQP